MIALNSSDMGHDSSISTIPILPLLVSVTLLTIFSMLTPARTINTRIILNMASIIVKPLFTAETTIMFTLAWQLLLPLTIDLRWC